MHRGEEDASISADSVSGSTMGSEEAGGGKHVRQRRHSTVMLLQQAKARLASTMALGEEVAKEETSTATAAASAPTIPKSKLGSVDEGLGLDSNEPRSLSDADDKVHRSSGAMGDSKAQAETPGEVKEGRQRRDSIVKLLQRANTRLASTLSLGGEIAKEETSAATTAATAVSFGGGGASPPNFTPTGRRHELDNNHDTIRMMMLGEDDLIGGGDEGDDDFDDGDLDESVRRCVSGSDPKNNVVGGKGARATLIWPRIFVFLLALTMLIGTVIGAARWSSVGRRYVAIERSPPYPYEGTSSSVVDSYGGDTRRDQQGLLEIAEQVIIACSEGRIGEDVAECLKLCNAKKCCFEEGMHSCMEDESEDCAAYAGCEALA